MAEKKKPTAKRKSNVKGAAKKTSVEAQAVKANKQVQDSHKTKSQPLEKSEEANRKVDLPSHNKEFYQQLIDNIEDCLTVFDAEGTILFANKKAADHLLGLLPSAVIAKNISQFVPKVESEEMIERYRHVIETGKPLEQEVMFTLQGVERWFINTLKPFSFGVDNIPALISISREITKRKKTEESLKESEEKFSKSFQKAPLLITLSEIDTGKLLEVNDKFLEISGFTREEVIGRTVVEIGWNSEEQRSRLRQSLLDHGRVVGMELTLYRKDGKEINCLYNGETIIMSGKPQLLSIAQDITERIESENRFKHLISTAPVVIYTCKPTGDFAATFVSNNVKSILGYESKDFVADPGFWLNHIHPDDSPRILAELPAVFDKSTHTLEYRFLHSNGSYHWMHDELILIRKKTGEPLEMLGSWIDITERKKAEEALIESQTLLETVIETAPT